MVVAIVAVIITLAPAPHSRDADSTYGHHLSLPKGVKADSSGVPTPDADRVGISNADPVGAPLPSSAAPRYAGFTAGLSITDAPVSSANLLADTTPRHVRPKAVEYSDFYYTRLKIHQIGSYAILPLFLAEALIGQKLISTAPPPSDGLKTAHGVMAGAIGVIFVVNTITGGWNWWDSRNSPEGKTRRTVHSILMLVADAGFLATAMSAPEGDHQHGLTGYGSSAQTHRALAYGSITLATASTVMMWLWKK